MFNVLFGHHVHKKLSQIFFDYNFKVVDKFPSSSYKSCKAPVKPTVNSVEALKGSNNKLISDCYSNLTKYHPFQRNWPLTISAW